MVYYICPLFACYSCCNLNSCDFLLGIRSQFYCFDLSFLLQSICIAANLFFFYQTCSYFNFVVGRMLAAAPNRLWSEVSYHRSNLNHPCLNALICIFLISRGQRPLCQHVEILSLLCLRLTSHPNPRCSCFLRSWLQYLQFRWLVLFVRKVASRMTCLQIPTGFSI